MILSPRYDGPPIITIDGTPAEPRAALVRQRRRMQAMLAELTEQQWQAPSRCDGWTVRDVVAHLVGVNPFWTASISSGAAGSPTRWLVGFDPVTTPAAMVSSMDAADSTAVLAQFCATNDQLVDLVTSLPESAWSMTAEAPPGHVAISVLAHHALWDCWVHERDIALPLGIEPIEDDDEVRLCLRYAAVVSPALGMGLDVAADIEAAAGAFAVEASEPDVRFVVEVGNAVALHDRDVVDAPCLRGAAVDLIEALSLRAPFPEPPPTQWRHLLSGLTTAFAP